MIIKKITLFLFLLTLYVACKTDSCITENPIEPDLPKDFSANGYVMGFETVGSRILWALSVPQTKEYGLQIRYYCNTYPASSASLYVNDIKHSQVSMPEHKGERQWQIYEVGIPLNEGVNFIMIRHDAGDKGAFLLDNITININ